MPHFLMYTKAWQRATERETEPTAGWSPPRTTRRTPIFITYNQLSLIGREQYCHIHLLACLPSTNYAPGNQILDKL